MKHKIIFNFMIIIMVTLSLVMIGFGVTIKHYYYQSIANSFINQAEVAIPEWTSGLDFSNFNLSDFADEIIRDYEFNGAELKLLTRSGRVIQSSTGFYEDASYSFESSVLTFKSNYKIERNKVTGENILATYTPLFFQGQTVGVLRYATTLTKVNALIINILGYVGIICAIVAAIVFLISFRLGNSIVRPLTDIIYFTKKMAEGQYKERIEKNYPHELGEMAEMLNYMADEITKVERLKNDFISSISHELRTPLTGIKGWSETMQIPNGLSEEELKLGLGIINNEVDRLMGLVEDLLDFSRYQSGRIELETSSVKVHHLINEVTFQLQKKAERKGVEIIVETVPITITADGDKLKQVILNILDNAIKFSDKNSQIHVVQSINKDNVSIEIMDKGMGIEEDNLKDVLESFYKINPKSVGVGLGLAITRNIVEMHGGILQINSEYGKGTSVHIELPLEYKREG